MDALKKAEEEKKRAAKRLQEVEMEARETSNENNISDVEQVVEKESPVPELFSRTSQFSLEPLALEEKFDETKKEIVDDSAKQREIPTVDASEIFSEDLTLENIVTEGTKSQETFEESQKDIDLNDTTIIEGLSIEGASAPYDDTFHGVLFEEEERGTDVYEETLPGVPAEQLAKDLGGGQFQPTPVAAKTVFSAARTSKKQSSFKWGIFIVLALLAVGSFAIFYYFTITPVSRDLPSPLIARGIESSGVDGTPIIIPPVAETGVVTETIISPVIEETQTEVTEEFVGYGDVQVVNEQTIEQAEIAKSIIDEYESTEQVESKTDVVVSIDTATGSDISIDDVNETSVVNELIIEESSPKREFNSRPENIQVDSSLINISKSKNLEQENVMVSQAFKAYQDGHYDAAKSLYQSVLKNDPDNRDAHLGLAAIAISKQDRKSAYSHYVHLLELNPHDTLAMSALIGLSNNADPVKDESAIKLLIQREDDVPFLYFSLGNIYAKQQRWANAQQAFFDAYRLDTTNPDFVLNLAISLDQMGQYSTALDYYKTAVDLSQVSSSRFDSVPVNKRILVLSKLIESKL
jgi:tetratricopeptide (TPR) repeat protein